jgi:hypothetical protein
MAEVGSNSIMLIVAILSLIPGAYFAWKVLHGLILSLLQGNDDDF